MNLEICFPIIGLDNKRDLTTVSNKKCKQVERTFGLLIRAQYRQTMEYGRLDYVYDDACDGLGPVEICKQNGELNLTDLVEDTSGGCTYRQGKPLKYIDKIYIFID